MIHEFRGGVRSGLRARLVSLARFDSARGRVLACLVIFAFFPLRAAADAESHAELRTTEEQALREIESGVFTAEKLAAVYRTVGVSAALLGENETSRKAFIAALALDPKLSLAGENRDAVRSSWMEARGFWSTHAQRLSVELSADDDAGLALDVQDPAELVARVRVRMRARGSDAYVESVMARSPRISLRNADLRDVSAIEYSLTLIDEFGNRLLGRGSDENPLLLVLHEQTVRSDSQPDNDAVASPAVEPAVQRGGKIAGWILTGLSAAALGAAVYTHVQREKYASDWNSAECSGHGSTRGELCKTERQHIRTYERAAIGLYAGAGAALTAALVSFLWKPRETRSETRAALDCGGTAGVWGVQCQAQF
jgi:hypothetical protein